MGLCCGMELFVGQFDIQTARQRHKLSVFTVKFAPANEHGGISRLLVTHKYLTFCHSDRTTVNSLALQPASNQEERP